MSSDLAGRAREAAEALVMGYGEKSAAYFKRRNNAKDEIDVWTKALLAFAAREMQEERRRAIADTHAFKVGYDKALSDIENTVILLRAIPAGEAKGTPPSRP